MPDTHTVGGAPRRASNLFHSATRAARPVRGRVPGVTSWFHTDELQPRRKYRAAKGYELDDLLAAVGAHRDDEAFTALFDHFRPRVHAQMLRLGLAPFAAADVTQDVMETIWRKAHLFDRRKSAAATWVFRIRSEERRVGKECSS